MAESVVTVQTYAATHAVSERQVLKRITTGDLSGYQAQGIWYVRLNIHLDPDETPIRPIPVLEYAQQVGISVHKVFEDIATGNQQGFHDHGTWYVGIPVGTPKEVPPPPVRGRSLHICLVLLFVSVCALVAVGAVFWYQTRQHAPELAALQLEVLITNGSGASRPVVREAFFLVDKDLEAIADNYMQDLAVMGHISTISSPSEAPKWVTLLAGSTALRSLLFDSSSAANLVNVWEWRQNFEKSKVLWAPHAVQSAVTDSTGRAWFRAMPATDYWVVGWTETSTGLGFWNYKITIKGSDNRLLLTPENAVYFR